MSKHVVSLVYSRKAGSLLRKAVLAYMADVANHDGTGVWSSKQRIADEIEASKKGVRECIKSLVADGILTEVGQRKCMNGYTIEYAINLDVVSALEPMPHQKGEGGINTPVTPGDLTGELASPDGGTQFPQTVLNRPKPTPNGVVTPEPIDEVTQAYEAYQAVAERLKAENGRAVWPVLRKLSPKRRSALKARLKEYGLEAWGDVLRKAAISDFLCGRKTDWAADFEFLTSPSGFLKTLEGNYDNRTSTHRPASERRSGSGADRNQSDPFERLASRMAAARAGQDAGPSQEPAGSEPFTIDASAA